MIDTQSPSTRARLELLLLSPPLDLEGLCAALDEICTCANGYESAAGEEQKLRRVLRHAVLLLREKGEVLVHIEHGDAFVGIERATNSVQGVQIVRVILTTRAVEPDTKALRGYYAQPCVVIYAGTLRVTTEAVDYGVVRESTVLPKPEIIEFLRKRTPLRALRHYARTLPRQSTKPDLPIARDVIERTFAAILADPHGNRFPPTRQSHPYRGPILSVLPRLILPAQGKTILATIAAQLSHIAACAFDGILLGVVERQSVHIFLDEQPDGELVPHINTHGYWISGEPGLDPLLGTEAEYVELVQGAKELGLAFIQDVVYATLGYTPQIERFSARSHGGTEGRVEVVSVDGVDTFDASWNAASERELNREDLTPNIFARAMVDVQRSHVFELPRPDLYEQRVLNKVRARTRWLEQSAQVQARRIDMAKHLPTEVLPALIDSNEPLGGSWVILEYWSSSYRDLRFAAATTERREGGVYLYDFPLAVAVQDIFVQGKNFGDVVSRLQSERARWGIDLRQLIPVVVDHDKVFKPMFNGTQTSSAQTVVAHVFACLLSANAPVLYMGFDDARAGVPGHQDFSSYPERLTRRERKRLVDIDGDYSPAIALCEFFALLKDRCILSSWDGSPIRCSGDENCFIISREFFDSKVQRNYRLTARFSRGCIESQNPQGTNLFRYDMGPSVEIVEMQAE